MLHLDTSQLDTLTQDESVFDASLRGNVKAQYGAEGVRLLDGEGNFLAENDSECVVVYTDDGPFLLDAQVFAALYKVNRNSGAATTTTEPTPAEPDVRVPDTTDHPAPTGHTGAVTDGTGTTTGTLVGDPNTASTGTTTTTTTAVGQQDTGTTTAPPVTSVAGLFSHADA